MYLIGQSQDIHQLIKNKPLFLGGVLIDNKWGSKAISDGDVLIHAIAEAILGAIQENDLGLHFPQTDPKNKNIKSKEILAYTLKLLAKKGYTIVNIDTLLISDYIKVYKHRERITSNLIKLVNCSKINIKATKTENSKLFENDKFISAQAIVLIKEEKNGIQK